MTKRDGTVPAEETVADAVEEVKIDTGKLPMKNSEPRIYIGPSFKGVTTGTVYKASLTPVLEAAIKEVPAFSELVVPLNRLLQANRELSIPDSALRRIYQMAEEYRRGE